MFSFLDDHTNVLYAGIYGTMIVLNHLRRLHLRIQECSAPDMHDIDLISYIYENYDERIVFSKILLIFSSDPSSEVMCLLEHLRKVS